MTSPNRSEKSDTSDMSEMSDTTHTTNKRVLFTYDLAAFMGQGYILYGHNAWEDKFREREHNWRTGEITPKKVNELRDRYVNMFSSVPLERFSLLESEVLGRINAEIERAQEAGDKYNENRLKKRRQYIQNIIRRVEGKRVEALAPIEGIPQKKEEVHICDCGGYSWYLRVAYDGYTDDMIEELKLRTNGVFMDAPYPSEITQMQLYMYVSGKDKCNYIQAVRTSDIEGGQIVSRRTLYTFRPEIIRRNDRLISALLTTMQVMITDIVNRIGDYNPTAAD